MKTPTFHEYQSQTWEEIHPHYQELQDIELSEDTLKEWMKKWSDLRKLEDERFSLAFSDLPRNHLTKSIRA